MTNRKNGTLYTRVTNNLIKRVYDHKQGTESQFTARYSLDTLGYDEHFESIDSAVLREKQIKAGSRKRKLELITTMNPKWNDLYQDLI